MAIVYNSDYTHSSAASGTGPTLSYTCPSTPSMVFVSIAVVDTETCTVSMTGGTLTQVGTTLSGTASSRLYLFYAKNPTAGSQTITFTKSGSGSCEFAAWSYGDSSPFGSGLDQSGTFTGTTTISETLTATTTGMWMVAVNTNSGPDSTVNSNCRKLSGVSAQRDLGVFDSNGTLTGGSPNTMVQNISGQGGAVAATFSVPSAAVGPTTVKTWDGITQSTGVKTYFGVALASVKKVDGLS